MSVERLLLHPNQRFLATASGSPFFYLGETAWELFHRSTREEAEQLLSDRAAKGFNLIQAVALAELDGLHTPNSYGHCPLVDDDPTRPVEAYWEHVDWVVRRANDLGLYIGFLPTWGDKWNKAWGVGPEIFTPENAHAYGAWLGERYRDAGLIWILGGDRPMQSDRHVAIVRAMAEGLARGDGGRHLMTFHPCGGKSSSLYVHCEGWLDFHMEQTGHDRDRRGWEFYERDWELLPHRPFVNGEPAYEAHPNAFRAGDAGWLDDADVRRELYWAICGGAAGFTYGCHAIWQMYASGRVPVNGPRATWQASLDLPGAGQMQHGLRLVLSRPYFARQPASWIVKGSTASGIDTIRACRDADGSWAFVYIPDGRRVRIDLNAVAADTVRVTWFDPRSGRGQPIGEVDGRREEVFAPPYSVEGRDWVLILDDAERGYPLP